MITDKEISTLKNELIEMKNQLEKSEETYSKESIKDSIGELSMYDNHPADTATALFEREKDFALHEHAESNLGKVEIALKAIDAGTYGKCEVCNESIPFERLEAVPYTTLCIEHAKLVEQPIEEDVAINSLENPFEETQDGRARDYLNSFEEVAEFGTSDSPSDFIDPENPTYTDDNDDYTLIDQIVGNSITDNTEED